MYDGVRADDRSVLRRARARCRPRVARVAVAAEPVSRHDAAEDVPAHRQLRGRARERRLEDLDRVSEVLEAFADSDLAAPARLERIRSGLDAACDEECCSD